ncbi:uncharacterized protein B0I36DRAFT_93377 [Microdochium trichocladiopsis]|uniref:Uncharacterized protein n=1 Tax=Microdochium trichocladiopsis TaxID=1682393 RepID=A0A9P9BTH2_9PEZI|nr:uncharacterized protein B0I36DRAFT_93377 [Microdochium trichocladiopsis]KAH7035492.1 hypothetical protein B0I36DRAFT_93377 [Microdochium trichocladiopsis]
MHLKNLYVCHKEACFQMWSSCQGVTLLIRRPVGGCLSKQHSFIVGVFPSPSADPQVYINKRLLDCPVQLCRHSLFASPPLFDERAVLCDAGQGYHPPLGTFRTESITRTSGSRLQLEINALFLAFPPLCYHWPLGGSSADAKMTKRCFRVVGQDGYC